MHFKTKTCQKWIDLWFWQLFYCFLLVNNCHAFQEGAQGTYYVIMFLWWATVWEPKLNFRSGNYSDSLLRCWPKILTVNDNVQSKAIYAFAKSTPLECHRFGYYSCCDISWSILWVKHIRTMMVIFGGRNGFQPKKGRIILYSFERMSSWSKLERGNLFHNFRLSVIVLKIKLRCIQFETLKNF